MRKKIVFIGAGGYAKSVLDSLDLSKYEFCGFIDNFKPKGTTHLGYPILAKTIDEFKERDNYSFFISIGNNAYRLEKFIKLEEYQCDIINVVDNTAIVSSNSTLGKGVFVGKLAIVNSGVTVCNIGNHSNISTNSTLNGDVIVEDYCFIGSSSVITGQLRIGEGSVVGAGAVVIRNVKPRTVVAGVPAKFIKEVE